MALVGSQQEGAAEPVEDAVGAAIGRHFVVEELLGRGAMGAVYRVRDLRTGETLALKRLLLSGTVRDGAKTAHFEREYYTLSELTHPRIIKVHDYGVDARGPFYTMELLRGSDLRSGGPQSWRRVCVLLRDVASSLAILHARRLLHRDVSPRNVLCTEDGRAKLIDFGAMVPMGRSRGVAGTPPLVAPEALQQQMLDARADLYSLGALGYVLLTGRHAYPARTFDELRDLFRTRPRPPERFVPDIPAALSALIMELLSIDRAGRPKAASEVIERLASIGGLPAEERSEVSRAYLATPSLVGRDAVLVEVRQRMMRSLRGGGGTLCIEGAAGSGRSRLLDACVLEAKLMGAVVLRADAGDAAHGDYGVMSALCEQLLTLLPERARDAARLRRPVLSRLLPELAEPDAVSGADADNDERRHLQAALRDWFRAVARNHRVALAIDDIDRIDEPSAAVLAALAHRSQRRRLLVMVTAQSTGEPTPAHALIRDVAAAIELPALTSADTERLVGSLFNDSPGAAAMARRIHELSEGNPRLIMELAEQMVDRGMSRYSSGAWLLPDAATAGGLTDSISATLWARMAGLPETAKELAEVLALAESSTIAAARYPELLDESDRAVVYRALDTLVTHGVLVVEGSGYRFAHREWGALLARRVPSERATLYHRRLAALLVGPPERLAHHLMESGDIDRAIEVLLEYRGGREVTYSKAMLALLERILELRPGSALPAGTRMTLRLWLIASSSILSEADTFMRHAPAVLERLVRDSGLTDLHELERDGTVPEAERLGLALGRAQARYGAAPPNQRALPPIDAIRELSRLCALFVGIAAVTQDLASLERLPSLRPLVPLAPAIGLVDILMASMIQMNSGRIFEGRDLSLRLLAELEADEALEPVMRRLMRFGVLYVLGLIEATMGLDSGPARVSELERVPAFRVNAWRVHATYHLIRGNAEEAHACQRRAELFRLQDGNCQAYPGSSLRIEARAHWLSEDLTRVKETLARVEGMQARYGCWSVIAAVTRSHYRRLRGDTDAALETLLPELEHWRPGRHIDWPVLAAAHVTALSALGRHAEAVERGLTYQEQCRREGLIPSDADIMVVTASAMCAVGRLDEAEELLSTVAARCETHGQRGLNLGLCYEGRARVAMRRADRAAFERWAGRCAEEYGVGHQNAALAARYQRLVEEASHHLTDLEVAPVRDDDSREAMDLAVGTVVSRMEECLDRIERGRCALTILLEETGAKAGYLYGVVNGRLELLSALPEERETRRVEEFLEAYLEREIVAGDEASADMTITLTGVVEYLEIGGEVFAPMTLRATRDGECAIGAVAALASEGATYRPPQPGVVTNLAASLLDSDDVDPVTQLM